jgi:hypothetical protein
LEGGSNYWYYLPNLGMLPNNSNSLSEKLVNYIFEFKNAQIAVTDIESAEFLGYLSYYNISSGLQLFINEGYIFDPAMDAYDADILFQYIIMGKVIYG